MSEPKEIDVLKAKYVEKVKSDSIYSLAVDPDNDYDFSDEHKNFIRLMVEYDDCEYVARRLNITDKKAKEYYFANGTQAEIMRINSAIYHRQFTTKMLNMQEVGGYLTALITDNVQAKNRISAKQKLQAAKMLIDINEKQAKIIDDPTVIDVVPESFDEQIKDLGVVALKNLLEANKTKEVNPKISREEIIEQLKMDKHLSDEEAETLNSMDTSELLKLLEDEK